MSPIPTSLNNGKSELCIPGRPENCVSQAKFHLQPQIQLTSKILWNTLVQTFLHLFAGSSHHHHVCVKEIENFSAEGSYEATHSDSLQLNSYKLVMVVMLLRYETKTTQACNLTIKVTFLLRVLSTLFIFTSVVLF